MKILIVEDNAIEAALLTKTLQKIFEDPQDISHADTLEKAIAHLKEPKEKFDLVLLDLGLPDSHNWKNTYESVSPYTKHMPVVVMTSNKSPEVIEELLKHGVEDYIIKGSKKQDSDLLKETIEFAMMRHKVVDNLTKEVQEKDECMHWLTGGYSMK